MPELGVGLSLWLMPADQVARRFAPLIAEMAARLGSPVFDPHVTLLGGVTLDEAAAQSLAATLAPRLAPVPVRLVRAGWRPAYFRCLYAEAEGEAIVRAHQIACDLFHPSAGPTYEPHLSFVYADLSEVEQASLAVEVDRHLPASTVLDTLRLVRTTGKVEEWRTIGSFTLTKAAG